MFCQAHNNKEVHRVETLEKSADVLERTANDPLMSIRLSGVCDLIAAEECYHLTCLITFERRCMKAKASMVSLDNETDECMTKLCRELSAGLSRACVRHAGRMEKIRENGQRNWYAIPKKYLSRRTSFYEVVEQLIGSKASYVQQLAEAGSLLMYHGEQSYFLISRTLTKSTQSEMITSDSESSENEDCSITGFSQQNIFQDMVHVALRTRQDLLDTPGHSGIWKGIDLAHVEQVIPNSLYFFLRLLFGSIKLAHEGIEKDCEIDQTVCSIAQDIVYGVSNRRKLTPKHVGLGLAVHQATRSEALVELFHAANHTIGIATVRQIDTTIAQNILDRFAKNGKHCK